MNIIGNRKIWFIISSIFIIISIVSIILWGLKLGIDFSGGTLFELKFENNIKIDDLRTTIKETELDSTVQSTGNNQFLIKTKIIEKEQKDNTEEQLKNKFGNLFEIRYETIGPLVSRDSSIKALLLVLLASIVIIIYVAIVFRKVSYRISSWKFGICAIIALIHDAIIIIGLFAILGHFLNVEVDSMFITAVLTVISFSVHDTIVIFDRIRENLKKYPNEILEEIANRSIIEMMPRSINTSLAIILVLLSLYLFGGETTKYFALALWVGMIFGTYSSIFIASPILVVWQKWQDKRKLKI